MNWVLGLLKNVGIKDYAIVVLVVVIGGIIEQWHGDRIELAKAREVYDHPRIEYRDRVIQKLGPIRTRTIIIHQPSGQVTTEIVREQGEATTETVKSGDTTPVPLSATLKEPRTDRYLLTLGMNRLTPDFDGKAAFVGYGFNNRVDVQMGGIEHNGFSPWVLATLRF